MAKLPILNIDTLVERQSVQVDGSLYDMLNPSELSILDLQRFGVAGSELATLQGSTDLPETDRMKLISETLRQMVRIILRAPDEVLNRLTDVHRLWVVNAFNALTLPTQPAAAVSSPAAGQDAPTTDPQTGEKS